MQGIGYYSGQRIDYQKDRFWSVERSVTYRAIGGLFLFIGAVPLALAIYLSGPLWFYLLPASLLLPGIVIFTLSEGVVIDVETGSVVQWRKTLAHRKMRTEDLAGYTGVYVDARIHHGKAAVMVYEVWFCSGDAPRKIFSTSTKELAESELHRIALLTKLPQIEPLRGEPSFKKLIVGIVLLLLAPIVFIGLFMLLNLFQ
jgi:hypothetical protein